MNVCFVTDPLTTTAGAVRPAILLAKELIKNNHGGMLITPQVDEKIKERLQALKINVKVVGYGFSFPHSFPTLSAWAKGLIRQRVLGKIEDADVIVNTSSCIIVQSHVYYAQGIMTNALNDMVPLMPAGYRLIYQLVRYPLRNLEQRFIKRLRDSSNLFIANSNFCASMYRKWGIRVDRVINPPIDCSLFKPSSSKPSGDYVLTHFGVYGKEGKFPVIKAIADSGVPLRVFGKLPYVPKCLLKHSNITFLGEVTDRELVDLYSNALYTLFAFSHEPFGYIPLESMACGTPVLTYKKQGPLETVVNSERGWLVNNDEELVVTAVDVWKHGYDYATRQKCRKNAVAFDINEVFQVWARLFRNFIEK